MTGDPDPSETETSPRAQVAGLVDDVRSLAQAEWDYARARLSYSGGVVRKAGIYALFAVLAVSAAAIALVLGLLLIVASYWGPWVATGVVVLAFMVIAVALALMARNTAQKLRFDEDGQNG
ncbi:MAG: hypothetical protein RL481_2191 [Pseudomonadota bacterium]